MGFDELSEPEQLFAGLVNQAAQAHREGKRDLALDHFDTAVRLHSELGQIHPRLEAGFCNQLGIFLMSEDKLDQALLSQERALRIDQESGSQVDIGHSLHNVAGVLRELGRTDDAVEHFKQALAMFQALGRDNESSNTQGELATTLIEAGRMPEAEKYL